MSAIEELQAAVTAVAERVGPSIVGIGRGTRGSGVVIADGVVLTNAHNLRGDEVTVTFADGRQTVGTVAGVDGDGDLAVVKVETTGATPLDVGRRLGPEHRHRRLRRRRLATAAGPGSRSGSSRPSRAPSAARAAAASRAASSTPRRWRRAPPAARWSTPTAG